MFCSDFNAHRTTYLFLPKCACSGVIKFINKLYLQVLLTSSRDGSTLYTHGLKLVR